jgi:hypothetical protein
MLGSLRHRPTPLDSPGTSVNTCKKKQCIWGCVAPHYRVYGEDGADTIDAQTAVELDGAREEIFGGDGNDTITAADGLVDVIDCGLGMDKVDSYDTELDVLFDCETTEALDGAR